jgi:hypothetical protein
MDPGEKELYHQIHPAKLATDFGTTAVALYFFWLHDLIPAIAITLVPSLIASAVIIRFSNLEPYRSSRTGRYLKRYMTRTMEGIRVGGLFIMIAGAWFHVWQLIPAGILVILFGWFRGVILPDR